MGDQHATVFHVTCVFTDKPREECKKKTRILDKAIYKDAMMFLFGLSAEGEYNLQQFNPDFEDCIDIDYPAQFPRTSAN